MAEFATWQVRPLAAQARLPVAGCLLCLALAAGETDYGEGFARLRALGLPDTAAATYVCLKSAAARSGRLARLSRDPGGRPLLRGNAWLLEQKADAPARLVANQTAAVEVWDRLTWEARERARRAAAAAAAGTAPGTADRSAAGGTEDTEAEPGTPGPGCWVPVDLDRDLAAATAYLEAPPPAPAAAATGDDDDDNAAGDGQTSAEAKRLAPDLAAELLLLAAHSHRAGRTAAASRLLGALFHRAGGREQVITAALGWLAATQYNDGFHAFARSGDWAAWATALEALVTRYAGAWRAVPAVQRLAAEARKRATDKPPPLTGDGLTPEDQALAVAIADARGPAAVASLSGLGESAFWLPLAAPPPADRADDPFSQLLARGVDAIPLLAALCADTWFLTAIPVTTRQNQISPSWAAPGDDGTSQDEQVDAMYEELPKPLTRGEFALWFLAMAIPGGYTSALFADAPDSRDGAAGAALLAEFRRVAFDCYQEIRAKTPPQMAEYCLGRGDGPQVDGAFRYLLEHGGEDFCRTFEEAMLKSPPWASDARRGPRNRQLGRYASHRGPAAREFVERLAAAAAENRPPAGEGEDAGPMFVPDRERRDKWVESGLPQLRLLTSPDPLTDLLADYRAAKLDLDAFLGAFLGCGRARTSAAHVLGVLLQVAVDEPTATRRRQILARVERVRRRRVARLRLDESWSDAAPPAVSTPLDPREHAKLWRQLLSDERPTAEEDEAWAAVARSAWTVAETAAEAILELNAATEAAADWIHSETASFLGARAKGVVRAWAEALLQGGPGQELLVPLPGRVPPPRRTELLGQLRAAEVGTLPAVAAAFSLDELLAVAEEIEWDEPLGRKLLPAANRVVSVTVTPADLPVADRLTALKDQVLTRAAVQAVLDACLALAPRERPFCCVIRRDSGLGGVSLCLVEGPALKPAPAAPARVTPGPTELEKEDALTPVAKRDEELPRLKGWATILRVDGTDQGKSGSWVLPPATPAVASADASPDPKARADGAAAGGPAPGEDKERRARAEFWRLVETICESGETAWCKADVSLEWER